MATASLSGLSFRHAAATDAALREVDLVIGPGLTVVAGASGSGKSTLLRVVNGLVPHFHGGVVAGRGRVGSLALPGTPPRLLAATAGFVFQDPEAQFVGGTVEREVAFGLENLAVAPQLMRERVLDALARTGAEHLRTRAVATLSGGERQRVAIAAVVAMGCPVICLDEPTSQLDADGAGAVLDLCRALAREGMTVIAAEHRLDDLLPAADGVVLVDGGRVRGPLPVREAAAHLAAAPQVVAVGRRAALTPLPLTPGELAPRVRPAILPDPAPTRGEAVAGLEAAALGPDRRTPVLHGVDLGVGAGTVTAVVGPNGSGKTTLLRALAGLTPPQAGAAWRRPGRIALVPQAPGAVLHLPSVRAEIELTLRRAHEEDDVDSLLATFLLAGRAATHPRDLSSGERQRAALAALLCGRPLLALLDEPTRGMDDGARTALVARLRHLRGAGSAVVIATHDPTLIAEVADSVVEVRAGTVCGPRSVRAMLTGPSPYASQVGSMRPGGPITVDETLALL